MFTRLTPARVSTLPGRGCDRCANVAEATAVDIDARVVHPCWSDPEHLFNRVA